MMDSARPSRHERVPGHEPAGPGRPDSRAAAHVSGFSRAAKHGQRAPGHEGALTGPPAGGQTLPVTGWIYFIHPPRDDFAATMTAEEKTVWAEHSGRLQRLLTGGQLILAGPTLGTTNTGLVIFEAPDEGAARQIMEADPVISGGYAQGELRPFRVSLQRRQH